LAISKKAYDEAIATPKLTNREMQSAMQYVQGLMSAGEVEKAQTVLQQVMQKTPDQNAQGLLGVRMDQVNAMMAEKKGDKKKAVQLWDQFFAKYGQAIDNSGAEFAAEFTPVREHLAELKKELGMAPAGDSSAAKKDSVKKK